MPSKKKRFDINHMTPEDQLKFEIAEELGLADRVLEGGWRRLTSKESGRIGGLMTRRKREIREEALTDHASMD
ncbi:MAG: alpha/beta-type small acid-soluble spore protein [Clostridiales bacterium]|nr:alpha/beta-type small acid-soluble spore protein [Clostridiales bacterium]